MVVQGLTRTAFWKWKLQWCSASVIVLYFFVFLVDIGGQATEEIKQAWVKVSKNSVMNKEQRHGIHNSFW